MTLAQRWFPHFLPLLSILQLLIDLSPVLSSLDAIYPCSSTDPIKWVRDPNDCQKYFICYFGQPIAMPRCPNRQVWSNDAFNCVPEFSSWNDCHPHSVTPGNKQTTKVTVLNLDRSVSRYPSTVTISQRSTNSTRLYRRSTSNFPKRSTPSMTTPPSSPDNPCFGDDVILPHPKQCHWYYNCSLKADQPEFKKYEPYTVECPYPQLFDARQLRCREYLNMDCGSRFEPVDHCEYREEQCHGAHCIPCRERFANCRGKKNGIYPFRTDVWSPILVSCYGQRNVAQDKCRKPTPIFSPIENNCVSLFNVPKEKGGLRPDCSFRNDGLYADEQGRCSIYFECKSQDFFGYFECNPSLVFDPITRRCTRPEMAPRPCGNNKLPPSCRSREDGFYADEYGRCPYYFECRNFTYQSYHRCDYGSFDANQQTCIIPVDQMVQPCGLRQNPCNNRPPGTYSMDTENDTPNKCHAYMECSRGLLVHHGICKDGKVFSKETGRCEHPHNVLKPCDHRENVCANKRDGLYSAPKRGCSFYYECRKGRSEGYKTCNHKMGGIVFNSDTGRCDVRQNVCPPCGYKWFGCRRSFQL